MTPTVKVRLLGRDYLLRSQGEPHRVQEAAALVEEKLAGLDEAISVDTRDRFILALLNLAGEYLQERSRVQGLEAGIAGLKEELQEIERGEGKLITRIEDAPND